MNPGPRSSDITTTGEHYHSCDTYAASDCGIHSHPHAYDRNKLLQINRESQFLTTCRLQDEVWKNICSLGIARKRRVHRGKRGGRRKQRHIPVWTSARLPAINVTGQGINYSNLRSITRHNTNIQSGTTVHLWNARSLRNKALTTYDYILENDIDIYII